MARTRKNIAVMILAVLIILTVLWNVVLNVFILPNQFIKTEVEVINIQAKAPSSFRGGRQTNYFPTYKYTDDKGEARTLVSNDGYNWINGFLFEKKVGDKIPGYYEKGSQEGLFVTQTGDWWTFRLMPLVFGTFLFGIPVLIIFLYKKYKTQ